MIGIVLGLLPVAMLPALPGAALTTGLAVGSILLLYWPGRLFRLAAGMALGLFVALSHGQDLLQRRLAEDCVRQTLWVSGMVASLPRSSAMPDGKLRQRFELDVESIRPQRCAGPGTVLLSHYGPEQLVPGQRWALEVLLKRPWGLANPGSYNMQAWYAQTGIHAVGSVRRNSARLLAEPAAWATLHQRLRWRVSQRIAALPLDSRVSAILRAVTVADKSGIDSDLWNLLQIYGINHLLVISGLHVGLVAGAGHLLGSLIIRLPVIAGMPCAAIPAVLSLVWATGYAALAGFSLATQRALCMLLCFVLANQLGRSSGSANNLLLAALLVLLLNPLAVLGSGFWLSFGAVACLLWLGRWSRGRGWLWQLLSAHLVMSLAMLPLGAWWFGGSSVVAALANLLMVPLVGFVVVPLALLATVFFLLSVPGAIALWQLAAWPLQQLMPVAADFAGGGGHWMYRYLAPTAAEMAPAILAVLILVLPARLPVKLLAALMLLPVVLSPPVSDGRGGTVTRVTVLDVGQGTAVVVQAGSRALLYDTGGGDPAGLNMANSVLLPYLRHAGLAELDTLVVSHQDQDHSAGTGTLLTSIAVGRFLYGGQWQGAARGRRCEAGQGWRWPGGQEFLLLAPAPGEFPGGNDGSCVLLVTVGEHRLLLPGDIEAGRERELVSRYGDELRSDWLLAGHHGSLTSSSYAWLKYVQPAVAAVSSAYANRFGHPHPQVVSRLRERGTVVFGTAAGGALEFEFAPGEPVRVSQYRLRQRRFWM